MFYYEGLSCPVCQSPFNTNDDIVVCPQCGLPHHRSCWANIGHCFEADKHGTDQQWSRENARSNETSTANANVSEDEQVCSKCGASNPRYAEFCKRCGSDLSAEDWHSAPQSPQSHAREYSPFVQSYEAYSSSERIGKTNAADLAAVVGNNQAYYMTRFRRIEQTGKGGWNWAAFLLSPFWLFYRKQYVLGAIYMLVLILFDVSYAILYAPLFSADTAAMEDAILEISSNPAFFFVVVLAFIYFAMRVLLGIRANHFYLNHCEKLIQKAREKTSDISPAELSYVGGVSTGVAVLVLAIYYIFTNLFINLL